MEREQFIKDLRKMLDEHYDEKQAENDNQVIELLKFQLAEQIHISKELEKQTALLRSIIKKMYDEEKQNN